MSIKFKYIYLVLILSLNTFAQKVNITQTANWIKPLKVDYKEVALLDYYQSGYKFFFYDYQINVAQKTKYNHYALKIINNKGVEDASKLYFDYNPSYEKILIHSIKIYRNGVIINKIKTTKFDNLQREASLDYNIYNGKRTITAIIDNVAKGDVIEYDYSIIGNNPIFKNKFYHSFYLNGYNDIELISCKVIKPIKSKYSISYLNKKYQPLIEKKGSEEIITWEMHDIKGLKIDEVTPGWFEPYDLVEISEYNNWKEVIDWGRSVFENNYNSSKQIDEKIVELNKYEAPEAKIIGALRFVQNDIRYFGIEMGVNSHQPKSPQEVIKCGYGDCKDKSSLLCFLLKKMKIKAYPVLINTEKRIELTKVIPSPSQFNHVITMVELNNNIYFFDPTIPSQGGNLDSYYTPNYAYGLVLKDSLTYLYNIPEKTRCEIKQHDIYKINSLKGNTTLQVKTFYSGYEADEARYRFQNSNLKELTKEYLKYYEGLYKSTKSSKDLTYSDNLIGNILVSNEDYKIENIWDEEKIKTGVLNLGVSATLIKDFISAIDCKSETRNYPLFLSYPSIKQHIIEIDLPEKWDINYSEKKIENEFISYSSRITYVKNKLKLVYTIKTKKGYIEPFNYKVFKADIDSINQDIYYSIFTNEKLNAQIKKSNFNWLLFFIAILVLTLCILLFYYLYNKMLLKEDNSIVPNRLGGWLWIPFFALFFNAIIILLNLFTKNYFNKSIWIQLTDESSTTYIDGYASLHVLEMCVNVFVLVMSVFLVMCFLKSFRDVPRYMIIFYIFNFVYCLLDNILVSIVLQDSSIYSSSTATIRSVILASIWIPYFMNSKRVKNTFVC